MASSHPSSQNPRHASISSNVVIFGGNGDLALRKLIPALYMLFKNKQVDAQSRVFALSRTEQSNSSYLERAKSSAMKQIGGDQWDDGAWQQFATHLHYMSFDALKEGVYDELAKLLGEPDGRHTVYYLATKPDLFGPICEKLDASGLIHEQCRVVVEKPIGWDYPSACAINDKIGQHFTESQIFRIDHYLGKETVQNLLVLRFGNPLFESQWNHKFIEHIQITIAESMGVEGRGDFYDKTGALRDMVQNHLLQLLCMIAMEPPSQLNEHAVRDEKLKVLRSLRPMDKHSIATNVQRGQYAAGVIDGNAVKAYRNEDEIQGETQTETFVAIKAHIDNLRWAGVPFYLRTGKRLPERKCEIVVQFKEIAHSIFSVPDKDIMSNQLLIQLQPQEGISLNLCGKRLGRGMHIRKMHLNLNPNTRNQQYIPDAYERLLLDAIENRATLFVRRDELETAWQWIDPIIDAWQEEDEIPESYHAGTWGPPSSTLLLARDGHLWHE